jgi:hypothetical protein
MDFANSLFLSKANHRNCTWMIQLSPSLAAPWSSANRASANSPQDSKSEHALGCGQKNKETASLSEEHAADLRWASPRPANMQKQLVKAIVSWSLFHTHPPLPSSCRVLQPYSCCKRAFLTWDSYSHIPTRTNYCSSSDCSLNPTSMNASTVPKVPSFKSLRLLPGCLSRQEIARRP